MLIYLYDSFHFCSRFSSSSVGILSDFSSSYIGFSIVSFESSIIISFSKYCCFYAATSRWYSFAYDHSYALYYSASRYECISSEGCEWVDIFSRWTDSGALPCFFSSDTSSTSYRSKSSMVKSSCCFDSSVSELRSAKFYVFKSQVLETTDFWAYLGACVNFYY